MPESLLDDILSSIFVSDVISQQDLVYVTAGESLETAVQRLTDASISSVPVFQAASFGSPKKVSKSSKRKNKKTLKGGISAPAAKVSYALTDCLGVVDFSNVATAVVELNERGYSEHDPKKPIWVEFAKKTVEKSIKYNTARYIQVSVKSPIVKAIEKCAEFGLRRLLAINDKEQVVAILSPSKMMSHIKDAINEREEATMLRPISELSIGHSPVLTCTKDELLLTAFKRMQEAEFTAIGVIDPVTELLVGSISSSDIHLLLKEQKSGLLRTSAWKYIMYKKDKEVQEKFPFFSVSPDASLGSVMSKMLATKVHHLYVVDAQSKPTKVISFADICRGLLTYKAHRRS